MIGMFILLIVGLVLAALAIAGVAVGFFIMVIGPALILFDKIRSWSRRR